MKLGRTLRALFFALAITAAPAVMANITSTSLQIQGSGLKVVTESVTTGIDLPVMIQTEFGGKQNDAAPAIEGVVATGELTGPGIDTPIQLTTAPGHRFPVPGLSQPGVYYLQNVRLMNGTQFLQYASPAVAVITVTDLLNTTVTVRQLSPDELRQRGITVDARNFDVYDYTFTFTINGQVVKVTYPVVIDPRTHQVQPARGESPYVLPAPGLTQPPRWSPPTLIPMNFADEGQLPQPGEEPRDRTQSAGHVSIPAAIVIPNSLAVLHQYAVESNDYAEQVAGGVKPKEEVATASGLSDLGLPPQSIGDLRYSPDSEILGLPGNALRTYALDNRKGLVELQVTPPQPDPASEDLQAPPSLARVGEVLFTSGNARFEALKTAVLARNPEAVARFNSSALYRSTASERSYVLLPALQDGLLVAEVGAEPLAAASFADAVWLPDGAYAVRVIDRSYLAVIVDGRGFAHLLDLSRVDERADVTTPVELFPTAAASVAANALDPRILWTSDAPVADGSGFIAPIIDPDTGMMFTADLLGRRVRVGSVRDPKIRIVADIGAAGGLKEIASIVPMGVDPPKNVLEGASGSLAAFRVEAALPGSMQESLGGPLTIAVESESLAGLDGVPQTPLPYPRAHLRLANRAGVPETRPRTVALRRVLDAAPFPELRFQRGYNRFVSDWIVAIADPRAAKEYGTSPPDCASCTRPAHLDVASDVHELYTAGRFIAVRPELPAGAYSFLSSRMTARVTTTPADTVRPVEALVAAQHPPVAEGMLQETTYLHSGEVETSAIDYDAGGRAGWNVVIDRTYRSRTIGLTPFGSGWDSALFRRLRPLPNGDVEYRDGAEVWRFRVKDGAYSAPQGVFLRLVRQNSGWSIIDSRLRSMRFDDYGRIVSESDEFHDPRVEGSGNTVVYLYGGDGRLSHVVDPVGRATMLKYDSSGRVQTVTDWHEATPRSIDYGYENGVLAKIELPDVINISGGRPAIHYAYEPAGSGYKAQLELATNLSTITDPGIGVARVDFAYDANSDRVTSQKWATGETASFSYSLPASATATDVLGQLRSYTFSGENPADPLADRVHAASITEQVEIWSGAPAGQLPASVTPGASAVTTAARTRKFTYSNGILKNSEVVGLRRSELGWEPLDGALGLRLKSQTAEPLGGGGGAPSFLPPSTPISRLYHYQGAGPFLQAVQSGGKKIERPEPHRYQKAPEATNDSITSTETFDRHGRLTNIGAAGGLDPKGAGANAEFRYHPETGPKYRRGLPELSVVGPSNSSIRTGYEYPSETRTIVKDARGVITETDYDTWNRPVNVRVTKPGDPLVIKTAYEYDAAGRLRVATQGRAGGDVVTTFDYDAMGRQTAVSQNQIATVGTVQTTTVYDIAARRTTTMSPGGATTTVELDSLGRPKRSVTNTGSSPIEKRFAYDIAGNLVFETDMLAATASACDVHGRVVGVMSPDGTVTTTTYDEWGRPGQVTNLDSDGIPVGDATYGFTEAGRITSMTTAVDGPKRRTTTYAWDGGGRTTGVSTNGRASRTSFDEAGRPVRRSAGGGDAFQITDPFSIASVMNHDGWLARNTTVLDKSGQAYISATHRDTAGNAVENTLGQLSWKQTWDEVGTMRSAAVPRRLPTTYESDGRGAVEKQTLPDGSESRFTYHSSGSQASYTDPANEPTTTVNDLLGRPLRREYADGTTETIVWESSRLKSVTDRQGRTQTYAYNAKGQLEEILEGSVVLDRLQYDRAGRLTSWKTADTEIAWGPAFDAEGRPKTTSQRRFLNGSGLGASPQLLDEFVQSHEYNEHGERTLYTMPAAPAPAAGWTQSVQLGYDAMGNLDQVTRGGLPLMTASHFDAGRPGSRTVTTTGGGTIVRSYGYDGATSLMSRMSVEAGGVAVAGSAVERDGLQLSRAQLLGVSSGQRFMHWRYDTRSRLIASLAGAPAAADPLTAMPGRTEEELTRADFRSDQRRVPRLDPVTAASLAAKGIESGSVDPPGASFEEQAGHKIAQAARGAEVRPFVWAGAERVDDGRFTYEFDSRGRLIRATEKGSLPPLRRMRYTYSGTGRMVGRRAEYAAKASPDAGDWKLEDRPAILEADGLPADTTLVWDAVSDNLAAIFKAPSPSEPFGAPVRQFIHGGAGYDDPIEITAAGRDGTVSRLYPVYDEAGAGTLQAVLDASGALLARTVPNDPYGGEPVDFTGPAIDRVSVDFRKDANGTLTQVEVNVHTTEELKASSIATGIRLAAVDNAASLVRTAPGSAALAAGDAFTARWTLTPDEWNSLIDPSPEVVEGTTRTAVALSIAATDTLRGAAWAAGVRVMPAPEWVVATKSVFNDRYPVEVREPLTNLATALAKTPAGTTTPSTLYAVEDLLLLGTSERDTIIEELIAARFQALPFAEPATGLVYARARWYDPSTGSFLTPDPMGYRDSSNLYAFGAADPVNGRDPTGEAIVLSPGALKETWTDVQTHASVTWKSVKGIGRSVGKAVGGTAAAINLLHEASKPGNVQAQLQLVEAVVATHGAVAQWGTSAGYAIAEPELIGEAITGLSADDFSEVVFDAAITTAGIISPAARARVPATGAGVRPPRINTRHVAQAASVEELDALITRLGDRAVREGARARSGGVSGIDAGNFAEATFGRYVGAVNKRLGVQASPYVVEWQPAMLPGYGRVPAFVQYANGQIYPFPGSLRLDAGLSDATRLVSTPAISADVYPTILRGYDVTLDAAKVSAVAKYQKLFGVPIRDIRPR